MNWNICSWSMDYWQNFWTAVASIGGLIIIWMTVHQNKQLKKQQFEDKKVQDERQNELDERQKKIEEREKWRIELSTKQIQFDKRIESYSIISGLMQLCDKNVREFTDKGNELEMAIQFDFSCMTNNSYLEELQVPFSLVKNNENGRMENPKQDVLLKKFEELEREAEKVKFLFSIKEVDLISEFILSYKTLLEKMYKMQVLVKCSVPEYLSLPKSATEKYSLEDAKKYFLGSLGGIDLSFARKDLKNKHEKLIENDVKEKLSKQIRLVK